VQLLQSCLKIILLIGITTAVVVAATGSGGFRSGSFKPRILSATSDCIGIELGKMTANAEEINGKWTHTYGRGKIKITRENNIFQVKWTGTPIISTQETVQISGKSLLVEVQLKHSFGICSLSFKLPEVLI